MLAIVAFGFSTGCSDADRATGGTINGDGVYFPTTFNTMIYLEEGQSSVDVPVHRSLDGGSLTMPIILVEESGKEGFFTAASSVKFVEGSKEAVLPVNFKLSDLEVGVEYNFSLLLGDDSHAANFGLTSVEVTIILDPWNRLGVAYWRDDIFAGLFGTGAGTPETECVAYEHKSLPGYYMIKGVYTPAFAGGLFGYTADEFAGNVNGTEAIYIDATNPNKVIMEYSETGFTVNSSYGYMVLLSNCEEVGVEDADNLYGTLKKGIITFPAKGLLVYMPASGGLYTANSSGLTRVVLPGAIAIEPAVEVDYRGVMIDPDMNVSAIFDVEPNKDAAKVLWTVATADVDVEDLIAGVQDGSVEAETIQGACQVEYAVEEPGDYVAVFVPTTADNSVYGTAEVVEFDYSSTGGVTAKDFVATITVEPYANKADVTFTPNSDKILYYWDNYSKADIAEIESNGFTLEEYITSSLEYTAGQYGMSLEDVIAAFANKGTVEYTFEKLTPETEYVAFAYAIDATTGEAKSAVSKFEYSTLEQADADPEYAAFIGNWAITSTSSSEGTPMTFTLTIAPDVVNSTYSILGWDGCSDFSSNGVTFEAGFVPSEGDYPAIFTISEQILEGPKFNTNYGTAVPSLFGFFNAEGETYYMGQDAIVMLAVMRSETSAQLVQNSFSFQGDPTEYTFVGLAPCLYLIDGSNAGKFLTYPYSMGTYTMTKIDSSTSAFNTKKMSLSEQRINKIVANNPTLARRQMLKDVNYVMKY